MSRFILSRNTMPGSPFFQACWTSLSNMALASLRPTGFPSLGLKISYSVPSSAAFMKASVRATEMLKLVRVLLSSLQVMKRSMSGWSTRSMPMLAPRLLPPCLIVSVAELNTAMKETGPDATPPVERTTSPAGRREEKSKPVPPPL